MASTLRHTLLYVIEVAAHEAVDAEFTLEGGCKVVASPFHLVLSSVGYGVVHQFLYAASLPHQSKVGVGV